MPKISLEYLDRTRAQQTRALLRRLDVSLFGTNSPRLHAALVNDAVAGRIDGRIATMSGDVCGVVLAAPRAYWTSALLRHWSAALDCLRARIARPSASPAVEHSVAPAVRFDSGRPERTWTSPGDAWRIIFIGTAPAARGRGVAALLYRSLMPDRSLVAHIARENEASIRLHRSVGWRLYPDGDVVLAVHVQP
jgi:ribosomal protein S18 acetylase RimI-like enzyme